MRVIGGMFPFETALSVDNGYFQQICPSDGDISFMISVNTITGKSLMSRSILAKPSWPLLKKQDIS